MHTSLNLSPPQSIRCSIPRQLTLLPRLFKDTGGYSVRGFGKWHLGHFTDAVTPTRRGFDSFIGFYTGSMFQNAQPRIFQTTLRSCKTRKCSGLHRNLVAGTGAQMIREVAGQPTLVYSSSRVAEESTDLFLANRAREAIENTPRDSPLFVYLSWAMPHFPMFSPTRYVRSIQNQNLTIHSGDHSGISFCRGTLPNRLLLMGAISVLDEAHRIVIDALDRTGRFRDDTLIVFTTDNGGDTPRRYGPTSTACSVGSNYPLRGGKSTWFEGGIRLTSLVHSRGMIPLTKRGTTDESLISIADWKTTLLSATGHALHSNQREFDFDHWPRFSSPQTASANQTRSELVLQNWSEGKSYVVYFVDQDDDENKKVYKLIKSDPLLGTGGGYLGVLDPTYAHAEIEPPPEMPLAEILASGYHVTTSPPTSHKCRPPHGCLFDVSDDPQEMINMVDHLNNTSNGGSSGKTAALLSRGNGILAQHAAFEVAFTRSNMCDWAYYPSQTLFAMDPKGVRYASQCKAWVPWVKDNGRYKTKRDCPKFI